jgi:hypothetical protein
MPSTEPRGVGLIDDLQHEPPGDQEAATPATKAASRTATHGRPDDTNEPYPHHFACHPTHHAPNAAIYQQALEEREICDERTAPAHQPSMADLPTQARDVVVSSGGATRSRRRRTSGLRPDRRSTEGLAQFAATPVASDVGPGRLVLAFQEGLGRRPGAPRKLSRAEAGRVRGPPTGNRSRPAAREVQVLSRLC